MEKLIESVVKASIGAKIGVVGGIVVALTVLNYLVIGPTFGLSISDIEKKIQRTRVEQTRLDKEYIEKTA
ncbi:MAG TPA: pilus assembly protein PilP, partial [Anaeromyxobacter sp.]